MERISCVHRLAAIQAALLIAAQVPAATSAALASAVAVEHAPMTVNFKTNPQGNG